MVFGWWVFAATAIFLSRYFKPMWPDTKLCGQAVWFQVSWSHIRLIKLLFYSGHAACTYNEHAACGSRHYSPMQYELFLAPPCPTDYFIDFAMQRVCIDFYSKRLFLHLQSHMRRTRKLPYLQDLSHFFD